MTSNAIHERRLLPRLLCNQYFSRVVLTFPHTMLEADAINFNYLGIGLFGAERLPADSTCNVNFHYVDNLHSMEFKNISSIVIYKNETEVGCQAGLRFDYDALDAMQKAQLQKLHDIVQALQLNGRYGLWEPE